MQAHGEDLRGEVRERPGGVELVTALKTDYRQADLTSEDRAMLDFVVKLTLQPASVSLEDLERLRGRGFNDGAIHDMVQVTALFAYYNRLAEGLGVDREPEWSERETG